MNLTESQVLHLPPLIDGDDVSTALETLVQITQALDIPDASFAHYSSTIDALHAERHALMRSLLRLQGVEDALKDYLASLKLELNLIKRWNGILTSGSPDSIYQDTTATLEKRKEALVKKSKEHYRELESLQAEVPLSIPISINKLLTQKEKNQLKEREIREKRARIKAFQGLPPNLELARHELKQARRRQTELTQLRERLLAKMADGLA
ncbi:hypothetical protein JR316_0001397 [Psilocybe cubensis]|uniref:Uncharacterized protein n=2 Tax=Psilocybe cubensis TaxID=181762 RepID=A0A8H7Y6J0_PSICU|nr:hypothetical protein JR316_0001397 [Psilocybe cubensis]KAH9487324.1 hypothetical protein JR316_0001397 [Psilocybe cubensis]